MNITLNDSRRLTGPNLYWRLPSAIIDADIEGVDAGKVVACWQKHARRYLDAVDWQQENTCHRIYHGGISLLLSAPIDVLYAATEINEAAFHDCVAEIEGEQSADFEREVLRLRQEIADEAYPALLLLQAAALTHGKRFLWDDDEVSIGYGATTRVWPAHDLPDPSSIDWDSIGSIPIALVTGTNGKSTSVRLAASIMNAAGMTTGVTSTDYIRVGNDIIDTGDYSGTGGARTLVRDTRTDIAILEVARGGLLRRGLGVNEADAVLITNVSADHLGEYGINTVPELIEAKFIVQKAINPEQPLILNADDEGIVNHASGMRQRIIWFSEDHNNPVVQAHLARGGEAVISDNGQIVWLKGTDETVVTEISDIPITLNGAAHHNVQNALGVTALAMALGVTPAAVASGLKAFSGSEQDNPGRGNIFTGNGVHVLVDFAHNEAGVNALMDTIRKMPAKRRLIMISQAGDRSDSLIRDLVHSAMTATPDCLVVCEIPGYERGRKRGEVSELIARFAIDMGMPESAILFADDPKKGAKKAIDWARSGDLLLLLALTQREDVFTLLKARGYKA